MEPDAADLERRIEHTLQELRVVLPGTQALFGFQLVAVFSERFGRLSNELTAVHLASLSCVCISVLLLMAPASYHRLVAKGQGTEDFQSFASRSIVGAMAALLVGLCADLFLIFDVATGSFALSSAVVGIMTIAFGLGWFGLGLLRHLHLI